MQQFLIVCPLVFLAGFVDSIAGGGGLISFPAYMLAGVPVHVILGTSKLSSFPGAIVAAVRFAKNKYIRWRLAIPCAAMAVIGAAAGSRFALMTDERIIKSLMLVVLPVVAFCVLKDKNLGGDEAGKELPAGKLLVCGMAASLLIGAYDGFYGPGTGTFLILVFSGLLRLNMKEAAGRVHKTEGSGLGMAITKYIVDAMEGEITVQSKKGEGTTFSVVLDFEIAPKQEETMLLPEWNVLVADDDRQMCESTVRSLDAIGIHADWTLDGESAVKMVCDHQKAHKEYHVVLLDWKLPGMDGIETAKKLRARLGPDIPILLITAYDWSEIEAEAREAGISGFLSKPLFKSTLFYGLKPFADREEKEAMADADHDVLVGKHILLAEDNELNREIAEELLGDLGLKVDSAENGKECVEKFESSAPGYYGAVLMDLRMPIMNGYEAADAIRASERSDAGIPIIAMTADAFSTDVERCLAHGMNAHTAKPIDMAEMTELLEEYLQRGAGESEPDRRK